MRSKQRRGFSFHRGTSRFVCIVLLLVIGLLPSLVFGQLTARALGLGGAYTALARGVHAQAWNPANLGLPDNSKFSFTFVSVGAGVWNNSFTKDMWDEYIYGDGTGVEWTQQDIEDILGMIPADGFGLDVATTFRTLSFSAGRFAFSITAQVGSYLQMAKSFFDLALEGNELGETHDFSDTDGEALGLGIVSLSWGQPIAVSFADAFAVGANLNLLFGGGYARPDRADFSVTTTENGFDVDGEYEATATYLGDVGFGLDLGAAAQFGEHWTVSLAIGNVLGNVSWSGEEGERYVGYVRGESLTAFTIAEDEEGEDAIADSSWTEALSAFSTQLPRVLRVGAALEIGTFLLAADFCQGFKDGPYTTIKPQISVGTEWRGLSWLPLRMGFVVGGRIGFGTSFGLGFRPGGFVLDIGVINGGFVVPQSSKGVIVGFDFGIDLQRKKEDVFRVGDF